MSIENKNLLPVITSENDIYPYLKKINQFPMLTDEEEKKLAIDWLKNGNTKSAEKLVTSHLRLVAKIAMGYRGYGLPVNELISEGNIGLIQSLNRFDPKNKKKGRNQNNAQRKPKIKAVNKNNTKKFLKILIFIVVSLISCVLC